MIDERSNAALEQFLKTARREFDAYSQTIGADTCDAAANLILAAEKIGGRVHVTGIGKPGHVAAYTASLLSSTGTPAYFLHGTEAVHGSCGQLMPGDAVICISNSGETEELKSTVAAVKKNGCRVIAVTGNPQSWLAGQADACLFAGVGEEGGPLGRAPRASVLAELLALQALSVVLQARRGLSVQEYVLRHPGGKLGQLREEPAG
ncbi:MAG: SIS domain-containing protein [Oscillibacter sp.]|jgi:D-arabinose 5-phosphate isomerase GutQ|nr:SIS domain-containing protein [Oscillibacter sp.]